MRVYVGQTRSAVLIRELTLAGVGECTVTGELDPRRRPWFHDNGAWRDHVAGRPFNVTRWLRDQWRIRARQLAPDFIVAPDIVAGGDASLEMSAFWRDQLAGPAYVVVQNGMTDSSVAAHTDAMADRDLAYAGVFVGGSLEWKLETSAAWVRWAHARRLRVHIGRVGVVARMRWARDIGADSIDSSLPLMHRQHLDPFLMEAASSGAEW